MRVLATVLLVLVLSACAGDGSGDHAPAPSAPAEPAARTAEADPDADSVITILYLGDSLTAGYGLAGGPDDAYPALIQARLDSLGIPARTINAGISGDTSAGGRGRVGWYLNRHRVDVLVLALGANDGLRGLPAEALRDNLETIIDRARESNPNIRVVLAGMMVPPSMGSEYFAEVSRVFSDVAREKRTALVPFLLQDVAGVRAMNLPDGVHPNAAGQRRMAETVWQTLRPVVEEAYAGGTR
jgi:acyl-CoA thioesterase I